MDSQSPNEYTGEGTNDSGESEQGIPLHLVPFDAALFCQELTDKLQEDHRKLCEIMDEDYDFPFKDFLDAFPSEGKVTLSHVFAFADSCVRNRSNIMSLHQSLKEFLEERFKDTDFTEFSLDNFCRSAFQGVLEEEDWREILESVQNVDFKESARRALDIAQRELQYAEQRSAKPHRRLLSGIIDDCLDRDREDESITANIIKKNPEIIAALRLLLDSKESLTMKQILAVQPYGVALRILKLIYVHALPEQVERCISSIAERKKGHGTFSSYALVEVMKKLLFATLAHQVKIEH